MPAGHGRGAYTCCAVAGCHTVPSVRAADMHMSTLTEQAITHYLDCRMMLERVTNTQSVRQTCRCIQIHPLVLQNSQVHVVHHQRTPTAAACIAHTNSQNTPTPTHTQLTNAAHTASCTSTPHRSNKQQTVHSYLEL